MISDTNNATQIHPKDAPPHRQEKFRRFVAYNKGTWNGPRRENKTVKRRQDDLARYDALASKMPLTDYQQSRGRGVFDELDFHEIGHAVDKIIFAVGVVVANEGVDEGFRYWPHPEYDGNDEEFTEIADEVGMSAQQQLSVMYQVLNQSSI